SPDTSYAWRIVAFNAGGASASSTVTVNPLSAPANVAAVATPGQVKLTWKDLTGGETGFQGERKTGSGAFAVISTTSPNAASFPNTGRAATTTYPSRLRAVTSAAFSSYSNMVAAPTPPPPPAAPTGLTLSATDSTHVVLKWSDKST